MEAQQSRDCQKKAWKYHKSICTNADDVYAKLDALGLQKHKNDPSFSALREQLETLDAIQKWCHRHRPVLFWSCFNAFDLRNHPERGTTHVMLIQIELSGKVKRARDMFTVVDASLFTRAEIAASRPLDTELLAAADQEHAARERRDRVQSPMLIALGSWAHFVGPLWDNDELAELTLDQEWKTILKSITDGNNEFEMADGNPIRREITFTSSFFR